jgi:hypothetical protein
MNLCKSFVIFLGSKNFLFVDIVNMYLMNLLILIEEKLMIFGFIGKPTFAIHENYFKSNGVKDVKVGLLVSKLSGNRITVISNETFFGKQGVLTRMKNDFVSELQGLNLNVSSDFKKESPPFWLHQIYFRFAIPSKAAISSVLVTHIDSRLKLTYCKWLKVRGCVLICLSKQTAQILATACSSSDGIVWVNPESLTSDVKRKVRLIYFSNSYMDGRKREQMFLSVLNSLDPSWLQLSLMGSKLEGLYNEIIEMGIEVDYRGNFDSEFSRSALSTGDFLLYFGMDEGAMSVLDAMSAGVPVLTSSTGFHLDLDSKLVKLCSNLQDYVDELSEAISKRKHLVSSLPTKDSHDYVSKVLNVLSEKILGAL